MYCGLIYLVLYTFGISDFTFSAPIEREDYEEDSSLCPVIEQGINKALNDSKALDPFYFGDIPKYKFEDSILKGLSRLYFELKYCMEEDDTTILESILRMKDPEFVAHWKRAVLFYGSIIMKATEARFHLKVELNTAEQKFRVTDALLTKLDEFKVGFTGLGPLNPIAKGITHLFFKIWREKITKVIQNLVKEDIEERLNKLQIL